MRRYPRHYNTYLLYARDHNMSCPEGRALVVCNRIQNGGWWYCTDDRGGAYRTSYAQGHTPTFQEMLAKMRSIRPATAKKWLKHWRNGGSIKTLRTNAEQNAWRRKIYAQDRLRALRASK